jgi:hypothetical protein
MLPLLPAIPSLLRRDVLDLKRESLDIVLWRKDSGEEGGEEAGLAEK